MAKKSLTAISDLMDEDEIAHPIDAHVGGRIRLRRKMLRLTQSNLATLLGVSFQQVQKYESGANRIGCGRLFEISIILQTPIGFFFQDIPKEKLAIFSDLDDSRKLVLKERRADIKSLAKEAAELKNKEEENLDPFAKKDVMELVVAYSKIADPEQRSLFLDLAKNFVKAKTRY